MECQIGIKRRTHLYFEHFRFQLCSDFKTYRVENGIALLTLGTDPEQANNDSHQQFRFGRSSNRRSLIDSELRRLNCVVKIMVPFR